MKSSKYNDDNDYLHPERYLDDYKERLEEVREFIEKELKELENFLGVNFCDVSANGIQIRGGHKVASEYGYVFDIPQPTVEYDLSNLWEVADEFIEIWRENDNEKKVNGMVEMFEDFKKWGTT